MFISLLTVLFIGLKLCGVIAWSWVWVLSPIWLSVLFFIVMVTLGVLLRVGGK